MGNLFGLYSFFHQSCATGTLLLQKEIYPQKSLPNLRQLIFCRLLKSLKVTPAMIAIPGVPGNKETSKEIRNRKICTRRGSREQVTEVQGLNTKASSLPPLPPAHETNPMRGNVPRGTESGVLVYARHPERNLSFPHDVRYTSLLPLLKSPTVSHTAARALPKETGISVRLGR